MRWTRGEHDDHSRQPARVAAPKRQTVCVDRMDWVGGGRIGDVIASSAGKQRQTIARPDASRMLGQRDRLADIVKAEIQVIHQGIAEGEAPCTCGFQHIGVYAERSARRQRYV